MIGVRVEVNCQDMPLFVAGVGSTLPLDHQQQIADNSRLRKFNTSRPRSRFCGEKRRVTRQKETILKQGVSRIHRNNFEYTNFTMI